MVSKLEELRTRISHEQDEREVLESSRSKLQAFWAIDKQRIQKLHTELVDKDNRVLEMNNAQASRVRELKEKVKDFLLDLHQDVTVELIKGEQGTKQSQDMHRTVLVTQKKDNDLIREDIREEEMSLLELENDIRKKHNRRCYELRKKYELKLNEARRRFEHETKRVRDATEAKRSSQLTSLEAEKARQTARRIKEQEKVLGNIREYFADITHSNLENIKELKSQVTELRRHEERDELAIRKLARENERMTIPLQKAKDEVAKLQRQLVSYEAEKKNLREVKGRLLVIEDDQRRSAWQQEVLEQSLDQIEARNRDLHEKFLETEHKVSQRSGFQRMLTANQIHCKTTEIARSQAELCSVLHTVGQLPPAAVRQIAETSNPMDVRRRELKTLQSRLREIDAGYRRLITSVRLKMKEFGLAPSELGFSPHSTLIPREPKLTR